MKIGELKDLVNKSDSLTLEPLRTLFGLMDYINNEYKKEHDGKKSPYYNDNIELGEKEQQNENTCKI